MRRVVAAARADLAEAETGVQRLRAAVARPHLEEHVARAEATREVGRVAQQAAAETAALTPRADREVEEMRLLRRDHEHEVTEQLRAEPEATAFVTGVDRVDEVAARPGMAVDRLLDRHHAVEIGLAHRREPRRVLEHRAHYRCSARCSLTVS